MSNNYKLLDNAADQLDVQLPIKENLSTQHSSMTTNSSNNESLQTRFVQIAIAVALYWYVRYKLF